jgi:hypothetical protein
MSALALWQEMAGRGSRMVASAQTRWFELLQVRDLYPKGAALYVILLASSMNIVEE